MHVAAIERIVHRTEEAFVFRAGLLLVGRREFVVVVADGREYGDSRLFGLQGHHHVAVERPFVVHQVAEVDGVARDVGRGGILPDVLGRFALEPDGVRRLVDLGVADADQIEEVAASHTSILCSPAAIKKVGKFIKAGTF